MLREDGIGMSLGLPISLFRVDTTGTSGKWGTQANGILANTSPPGPHIPGGTHSSDCHWEAWPSLLRCWLGDSL